MELFNRSTPEKAFKTSVQPLAGLFIFQSIGLLLIFSTWSAEQLSKVPAPFIPDPLKKYFLIANAILILAIGIGLFFRSRTIWFLFLSYFLIGPAWLLTGVALNYFPGAEPKEVVIPVASIIAVVTFLGVFLVTKPAFRKNS